MWEKVKLRIHRTLFYEELDCLLWAGLSVPLPLRNMSLFPEQNKFNIKLFENFHLLFSNENSSCRKYYLHHKISLVTFSTCNRQSKENQRKETNKYDDTSNLRSI